MLTHGPPMVALQDIAMQADYGSMLGIFRNARGFRDLISLIDVAGAHGFVVFRSRRRVRAQRRAARAARGESVLAPARARPFRSECAGGFSAVQRFVSGQEDLVPGIIGWNRQARRLGRREDQASRELLGARPIPLRRRTSGPRMAPTRRKGARGAGRCAERPRIRVAARAFADREVFPRRSVRQAEYAARRMAPRAAPRADDLVRRVAFISCSAAVGPDRPGAVCRASALC